MGRMHETYPPGVLFKLARLRLHRLLEEPTPYTQRRLAELALSTYGPIREKPVCRRRLTKKPDDVSRWLSKIISLERRPGTRTLMSEATLDLCELLRIENTGERIIFDLRDVS